MAKKDPYAAWKTIGQKVKAMAAVPSTGNPWTDIGNKVAAASGVTPAPAASTPAPDPGKPLATPAGAPWEDSTYHNQINNLQGNLHNFGAGLTGQGNALMLDYGITGPAFDPTTFDPNNPGTFTIADNVDVTNPFSRAALFKKSFQAQSRGDTNNYAARGQLYSGALQNAQNTDNQNYLGGQDSLKKSFASQYGNLYGQWLNAQGNELAGEGTAQSDAMGRWTASGAPGPTPSQVQVNAAKQFGQPLANAPYIGLGPVSTTSTPAVKPVKVKPKTPKGAVAVVKPKGAK